jgi:hypothetical protein
MTGAFIRVAAYGCSFRSPRRRMEEHDLAYRRWAGKRDNGEVLADVQGRLHGARYVRHVANDLAATTPACRQRDARNDRQARDRELRSKKAKDASALSPVAGACLCHRLPRLRSRGSLLRALAILQALRGLDGVTYCWPFTSIKAEAS